MKLKSQRGTTLLVSIVFLLVMTVLALSSIRGVNLQEHMASNLYDRGLALQAAEAALQTAQNVILANPEPLGTQDCSPSSLIACKAVPANTFQNDNTGWANVTAESGVNLSQRIGIPQYHIQVMGRGEAGLSFGQMNSANNVQYGVNPGVFDEQYYRITARSSNPNHAQERAVVVLQATIKRSM